MKKYIFVLFIILLVSSDSLSMGLLRTCTEVLMPNSKQKVIERELLKLNNRLLNIVYTGESLVHAGGRIRLIKKVLEAGANVNYQDDYGWTALMLASENGYIEAVRALLEAGANVNLQNKKSRYTALMLASRKGHIETVRALLAYGANVNHQDRFGSTALIWASYDGPIEIVRLLLAYGANVNHQDKKGRTALYYAGRGYFEIAIERLLISLDFIHSSIRSRSREDSIEIERLLREAGATE